MIHYKAKAKKRGTDKQGSGAFGASRGSRKHNGIDYCMPPDSPVYSPVRGNVTKLGYPYAHDLSFRYVEISDSGGIRHRVFYVLPNVMVGETVNTSDVIGYSQKLHYDGIKQHVHYEIKDLEGNFINPEKQQ